MSQIIKTWISGSGQTALCQECPSLVSTTQPCTGRGVTRRVVLPTLNRWLIRPPSRHEPPCLASILPRANPPLYLFTSIPTFPESGRVAHRSFLHVTGWCGRCFGGGGRGLRVGGVAGVLNTVQIFSMSPLKTILLSKWSRNHLS